MKNIFLTSCGIINDNIKNEFYNKINKDIKELKDIEEKFSKLKPLVEDIKVKIKIVKKESILRGQEYCILFYSEKKDNYLQNIGYLGEQLDLYLVSKNIGTWLAYCQLLIHASTT